MVPRSHPEFGRPTTVKMMRQRQMDTILPQYRPAPSMPSSHRGFQNTRDPAQGCHGQVRSNSYGSVMQLSMRVKCWNSWVSIRAHPKPAYHATKTNVPASTTTCSSSSWRQHSSWLLS